MISNFLKYPFVFVVYMLIQVMIINNINFGQYINPYIYILFLLILPVEISGWLLLSLGFITGITMDMFQNSPGIHASASVFLAFARPFILSNISPRDGYEPGSLPIPSHFGFLWFFKYCVFCVVLHHLFLFIVEAFSFSYLWSVIIKMILSSFFSLLFIMVIRLFGVTKKRRD